MGSDTDSGSQAVASSTDDLDQTGRVVLVTGGTKGIGRTIVQRYRDWGAEVMTCGRNEPDADLRCIEWKTGKVQWIKEWEPEVRERSSLMYADGHFVYIGEFGTLKLIKVNPEKYDVISEVTLTAEGEPNPLGFGPRLLFTRPAWAAPILSHGLLYVRGNDRLVCFDLLQDTTAAAE